MNHVKQFYETLDIVNSYHEAGHAIMTLVLGAQFQYVELAHPSQDGGNGCGEECFRTVNCSARTITDYCPACGYKEFFDDSNKKEK